MPRAPVAQRQRRGGQCPHLGGGARYASPGVAIDDHGTFATPGPGGVASGSTGALHGVVALVLLVSSDHVVDVRVRIRLSGTATWSTSPSGGWWRKSAYRTRSIGIAAGWCSSTVRPGSTQPQLSQPTFGQGNKTSPWHR